MGKEGPHSVMMEERGRGNRKRSGGIVRSYRSAISLVSHSRRLHRIPPRYTRRCEAWAAGDGCSPWRSGLKICDKQKKGKVL